MREEDDAHHAMKRYLVSSCYDEQIHKTWKNAFGNLECTEDKDGQLSLH
jgi:hypothetical protein